MTLFIFTLILSFVPMIYHSFSLIDRSITLEEDFEWNLFLIQLRNELQDVDGWRVVDRRLYIEKNNAMIKYEPYGQVIRRQVNELGHEIILQGVQNIQFQKQEQILSMNVDFMNEQSREARFLIQVKKGEDE